MPARRLRELIFFAAGLGCALTETRVHASADNWAIWATAVGFWAFFTLAIREIVSVDWTGRRFSPTAWSVGMALLASAAETAALLYAAHVNSSVAFGMPL